MRIGTLCYVKTPCRPRQYGGHVCEVLSERRVGKAYGKTYHGYSCRFSNGEELLTAEYLLIPITPPAPAVIRRRDRIAHD